MRGLAWWGGLSLLAGLLLAPDISAAQGQRGLAVGEVASAPAEPVAPASAPASAEAGASAPSPGAERATRPVNWTLRIDAPRALATLLGTYLDLARFQAESGQDQALNIRRSELRRLVVSAPEQVRALLAAQGYFSPQVTTRVGEELAGQPVEVLIKVEPGPRTVVSKVQLVFEGELDQRLSDNDPFAQALLDDLTRNWGLPAGQVFQQAAWSSAKNEALARLRADGYPSASWSGTSVTVDPDQHTARLFLVADSGPAYKFGGIRIEGLAHQPASAIVNLASFQVGAAYSERKLLDWQERIQKLNLFNNVFVTTDLDATQAGSTPVVVQVQELPLQNATAGVGVSSDTGPRVSLEHLHRNLLGLGWQSKTKLQLGTTESTGQIDLTSHPWPGRRRGLVSMQGLYLVNDDDSVSTSQYLRVGQLREGERLERTDYVAYQRAKVSSASDEVVSDASAVSLTSQWIFRDVDSQILPTKGSTSLGELTGGRTFSTLDEAGLFGRAYARITWYQPLWANWYASVRGELGQVFARDRVSVPDTQLFRAGGDDSVRGYAYHSLGVSKEGVVVGARSMATSSLELAHPLLARMPSLWGALFVDAGDAANRLGDLRAHVGYGAGVRWRSPVGPLRLDVAYGQKVQAWRVHFSVGISL